MNKSELKKLIDNNKYVFVASGTLEVLKREHNWPFDDYVNNALHVYDPDVHEAYYNIYDKFYAFANKVDSPMIYLSLTWRTNLERVKKASAPRTINQDTIEFFNNWRNKQIDSDKKIAFGGLIGPIGDCYKPEQAPTRKEAYRQHEWQIEQLINTNIDFLFPLTMPSVEEVLGICDVMQNSNFPYIISFVINSSGTILDGTTLENAFQRIDYEAKKNPPVGYMVNCSYPTFLQTDKLSGYVKKRLIGYLANASSKDFSKLDSSENLHQNSVDNWVNGMVNLCQNTNIKLIGGCCGTDLSYLEKLSQAINVTATDYLELANVINSTARSMLKLVTEDEKLVYFRISLGLSLQATELAAKGILRSLGFTVPQIKSKYKKHKLLKLLQDVEIELQKEPELTSYHKFLLQTPTINGKRYGTTIAKYFKKHFDRGPSAYPRNYFYPDEAVFTGPNPINALVEIADIIITTANEVVDKRDAQPTNLLLT